MNRTPLLLAGLLLLTGCWGTDRRLYLDVNFSVEEERLIQQAANAWAEAADSDEAQYRVAGRFQGRREFSYDEYEGAHESAAVFKISAEEEGYSKVRADIDEGGDGAVGGQCGIANVDYGRIVLVTECVAGLVDWEFQSLVMHELGHLLGLHDGQGRIMSDRWWPTCIDAEALVALCDEIDCGPRAHATCPK